MGTQGKTEVIASGTGRQNHYRKRTGQSKLFKALSHPLRVEILTVLTQRVASPTELAAELRQSLGNCAYHSRALEKAGLVEEVDTKQVRGAVEHFYRATARPVIETEEWEQYTPATRKAIIEYGLAKIASDATEAIEAGTFDRRPERHLSRTPLLLDVKGWTDLLAIFDGALDEILEIQAESAARRNGTTEPGIPVTAAMLCFEMPEPSRE